MLHNEARNQLAKDFAQGHKAAELAKLFSVSRSTVYRVNARMEETGNANLRLSTRGRKAKLSEGDKAAIDQRIREQPDLTIRELKEALQLDACENTIRKAVNALGYRRKKKMVHASEQERPRCAGKTREMENVRAKPERGSTCIPGRK